MLYQLIINSNKTNIDLATVGKIGIYLSFLNLLTQEAKHKNDPNYKVNLKQEFLFRNMLHAISALWMYRRQKGKQGTLSRIDIFRTLEGKKMERKEALEKYSDIKECQFLSHSYFGPDGDQLHFQHQSFAEILLAEYYLKVFIKFALDKGSDIEKARVKLVLGEPTDQTVQFFKELLKLLRDTATNNPSDEIIEKRRLLLPLMASLGTLECNPSLFSQHVNYTWYNNINIDNSQAEIGVKYLKDWPIREQEISKIVELAESILLSPDNYMLAVSKQHTVLYNREVLSFSNSDPRETPPDIDRWLALMAGNVLYNDESNGVFFAGKIRSTSLFFDMIRNWNRYASASLPKWGYKLLSGMDMSENDTEIELSALDMSHIDFSCSIFKNLTIRNANLSSCYFDSCSFNKIEFNMCDLSLVRFNNIKQIKSLALPWCSVLPGTSLPGVMQNIFNKRQYFSNHELKCHLVLKQDYSYHWTEYLFETVRGLLKYAIINNNLTVAEAKTWFVIKPKKAKDNFMNQLENLREFEKSK